jgi:hypothetical protein
VAAILALSGTGSEQKEFVSKMMLRPLEGSEADVNITRKRKGQQRRVVEDEEAGIKRVEHKQTGTRWVAKYHS